MSKLSCVIRWFNQHPYPSCVAWSIPWYWIISITHMSDHIVSLLESIFIHRKFTICNWAMIIGERFNFSHSITKIFHTVEFIPCKNYFRVATSIKATVIIAVVRAQQECLWISYSVDIDLVRLMADIYRITCWNFIFRKILIFIIKRYFQIVHFQITWYFKDVFWIIVQ